MRFTRDGSAWGEGTTLREGLFVVRVQGRAVS